MKNSQKVFTLPLLIIFVLVVGGIVVYINKDKILSNSVGKYIGNKLGACIIEENRGDNISPDIARAAALIQVNKNNEPFSWVSVGYYPIYRSSNEINYYAFIFRKIDFTAFTTLSSLEQNASRYSDTTQEGSNKKYQFNDIASVLTGAASGDPLIIRHYRGIPEIMGKKVEVKKYVEDKYSNKTIGNIISDSPMGKMYFEIVNKSNNQATGQVIGLDHIIISKSELVNDQKEIKDRKNKQHMNFDQKMCEIYRQALIEREADLKNQWGKYTQ